MQASPLLQNETDLPREDSFELEKTEGASLSTDSPLGLAWSGEGISPPSEEYVQLQQRIFLVTLGLTVLAVAITAIFFDLQASISVLVGAFCGVLYLRILARSVEKLGKSSKSVGKVQLMIPVLLVLAVSRLPQLDLLPSLLGFLLYKPSLIIQILFES